MGMSDADWPFRYAEQSRDWIRPDQGPCRDPLNFDS